MAKARRLQLILLAALALAVAGCGGDDTDTAATTESFATTEQTPTETTTTPAESEPAATGGGESGCLEVAQPEPKPEGGQEAPEGLLDPSKTYELVVDTSCGEFTIRLDLKSAPNTAASLVALAKSGFYDGTTFHRVVPGFVIQGGDPTGTGAGGPGYSTVDAPASDATYTEGVVAMAKTGAEPAGTSGSQFFVVTGADVGLPADYAIVGRITDGLEVVKSIDALGAGDGPPTIPVVIEQVTVSES